MADWIVGSLLFLFWGGLSAMAFKLRREAKEGKEGKEESDKVVQGLNEELDLLYENRDLYKQAYELSQAGILLIQKQVEGLTGKVSSAALPKKPEVFMVDDIQFDEETYKKYFEPTEVISPPAIGISESDWRQQNESKE